MASGPIKPPLRVLVVENDDQDRRAIHRALTGGEQPAEISDAGDLAQARRALRGGQYDCALVAHPLPDGCAGALLGESEAPGEIPVVVLLRTDEDEVTLPGLDAGHDYLSKQRLDRRAVIRAIHYAMERKRVERLKRQLLQADRLSAVGQLVTGIAHEINNPASFISANLEVTKGSLNRLEGFASGLRDHIAAEPDPARRAALSALLDRSGIDESLREHVEMCDESLHGIRRITSIVRDLRIFGRRDHDPPELTEVNSVIDGACNMVIHEIRHRGRLTKDLGTLPLITSQQGKLGQIFVNLLLNAAQALDEACPAENVIRISSRHREGQIIVAVEDNGPGIPPEDRARVFEAFFTTKPAGMGTGLGLALCRDLAAQHRGEMKIAAASGGGARFELIIPVDTGMRVPAARPAGAPQPERRLDILVVDDEELLLLALGRMLDERHQVTTAAGGAAAIELLREKTDFDVVLCDIMMPDCDGPAVYEFIAETRPELLHRVIFCSGGAVTQRTRDFLRAVPNVVLEKPVGIDRLKRVVEEVGAAAPTA